jgi:Tfp pilus assembly protein PilF
MVRRRRHVRWRLFHPPVPVFDVSNAYRELSNAVQAALQENEPEAAGSAYNTMGLAYESQGPEYDASAEAAYLEAVRLQPNAAATHSNLGNFYTKRGRYAVGDGCCFRCV